MVAAVGLVLVALATTLASSASYCIPGSGQVVDIRLKPAGSWGYQPAFFAGRAEALGTTAAAQLRITQAIVPYSSPLPTITIQAMARAVSSVDNTNIVVPANTLVAPSMNASLGVMYTVLPLSSAGTPTNTSDPPVVAGFDVNGEATIVIPSFVGFPTVGRLLNQSTLFVIQLQFVVGVTPVPGSTTILSLPLNVTASGASPTPWRLSFPPRFFSNDIRNWGWQFTTPANWTLGLASYVTDDRATAIPREGFSTCVTMNEPLRAFAVDVSFVKNTFGITDPQNYWVTIRYVNPTSQVLMDDGLVNNTAPINNASRAIFTGFQVTAALGTVQMLVVLIRANTDPFNQLSASARFAAALLRNVPALTFTLQVNRVRRHASRLTFLRQRGLNAAFIPRNETMPYGGGFGLVAGYVLPTITIGVLDSSGDLDVGASGSLIASFSGPTITSNFTAPIIGGIAAFDNLVLAGFRTLVGSSVVISFSAPPQLGTLIPPIAVSTLPLRVVAAPTLSILQPRAIMRLVFSPANRQFPNEGIPASVVLGEVLPTIQIHAADALDASLTLEVNALVVSVRCENLVDFANDCYINGTTTLPFIDPNTGFTDTGTVSFSDLRFSTMPSGGYVRLIFAVTKTSGGTATPAYAATLGYELGTGLIQIRPPSVSTDGTSVFFAVDANSQHAFLGEAGSDVVLVDNVGRVPVVSFLLYDGTRNINVDDSETGLAADVSGGGCRLTGATAYAWRGRVTFTNMRMLDCAGSTGLVRLVFTFVGSGLINRVAGRAWLSGPVMFSANSDALGWLRFVGTQPLFRHKEYAYVSINSQLPAVTLGILPTWSGDAPTTVTRTNAGITSIRVSLGSVNAANNLDTNMVPSNGTVLYNIAVQSLPNLLSSTYIWFCNAALVLPCLRRLIIFQYGWQPPVYFTRGPGPSIPLNSPLVINVSLNTSATLTTGSLDPTSGVFRTYNPTPSAAGTNPYLTVTTSEIVDDGANVTAFSNARFNSSGVLLLPVIHIVQPRWALTDGLLYMTLTSTFVPTAPSQGIAPPDAINVGMFPPVAMLLPLGPANASNELSFYIAQPRSLFQLIPWKASIANLFQISQNQLVVERIVDSQLTTDRSALTTTVEARLVAPFTVDTNKVNIDLIAAQVESFQPSCTLTSPVNLVAVRARDDALTSTTCDASRLTEWIEASAHCEEFRGADYRCDCYDPIFTTLIGPDQRCSSNEQMLDLCVYLTHCTSKDAINRVCSQVVPNVYLRIFFVVGGTAASLGLLTFLFRASDRFGKGTESVKIKHAKGIRSDREHHNDLFL